MIISPFILDTLAFTAALWNDIFIGTIALVCDAWAAVSANWVPV